MGLALALGTQGMKPGQVKPADKLGGPQALPTQPRGHPGPQQLLGRVLSGSSAGQHPRHPAALQTRTAEFNVSRIRKTSAEANLIFN